MIAKEQLYIDIEIYIDNGFCNSWTWDVKNLLIEIKEIEPFVSVSKITINKSEFSKKIASTAEVELVGISNALAQASEAWNLSKSKSAA